jgi:hypothetical protein
MDRPQMLLRQPAAARSARTNNLTQDDHHRGEPPKAEPEKNRKNQFASSRQASEVRMAFEWE